MKIAIIDWYRYNALMANCYFCGTEIPAETKVYRTTVCEKCGNPLKVCYHCRFYDPSAPHQCLEHISEPVRIKDSANFCDYFSLSKKGSPKAEKEASHKKAVDTFNSLFSD